MDNNQENKKGNDNRGKKQGWILVMVTTLLTSFIVLGMLQFSQDATTKEIGSLTPKIAESLIWLIFFNKFKFLVDRTAVLCYNTIIVQKGNVVYEIKN